MTVWQGELSLDVHVTLQAGGWISSRIMDEVPPFPSFGMQAARSVAGFATQLQPRLTVHHKAGMRGVHEVAADILMAEHAIIATDEFGTLGLWNHEHRPVHRLAGDEP
jgi:hypothetical protein